MPHQLAQESFDGSYLAKTILFSLPLALIVRLEYCCLNSKKNDWADCLACNTGPNPEPDPQAYRRYILTKLANLRHCGAFRQTWFSCGSRQALEQTARRVVNSTYRICPTTNTFCPNESTTRGNWFPNFLCGQHEFSSSRHLLTLTSDNDSQQRDWR